MVVQQFTVHLAIEGFNGALGSVYADTNFTGSRQQCVSWLMTEAVTLGHEDWLGVIERDGDWLIVARPSAVDPDEVLWDDDAISG